MKWRCQWFVVSCSLFLVVLPVLVLADDPSAGSQTTPTDDVQDLVFLDAARPVRIRLHITIDGKPYQTVWKSYIHKLFQYLDRDKDGILTKEEGENAVSAAVILQHVQRAFFFAQAAGTVRFAEMDTAPADGIVTEEELANYYRRVETGPILISTAAPPAAETTELFKLLDANKDGKLSEAELHPAAQALLRFDYNDDELISVAELKNAMPVNRFAQFSGRGAGIEGIETGGFFVVGAMGGALQRALFAKYDKNKNGMLSPAEVGLDQAMFAKFDANQSGQWSELELHRYLTALPDIEIVIRLGKADAQLRPVDVGERRFSVQLTHTAMESVLLTFGDAQVDVRRVEEPQASFQQQQARLFYQEQFKAADKNKDGFIDLKETIGDQSQVFRPLIRLADGDGDNRLSLKEILAFLDLQDEAITSCVAMALADDGRGLFAFLDSNRDGKLSQRELKSAWARLQAWDRNRDGLIAKSEIPTQHQISIGRAEPGMRDIRFAASTATAAPAQGPMWFRKMDRNGDGDVSAREFLGPREAFLRIDIDRDGLIDLKEAIRADSGLRQK